MLFRSASHVYTCNCEEQAQGPPPCVDDPSQYAAGEYADSPDPWEDHMHIPYCSSLTASGQATCEAAQVDRSSVNGPSVSACRWLSAQCQAAGYAKLTVEESYGDFWLDGYYSYGASDKAFHLACTHFSSADCPVNHGCMHQA